MLFLDLRNLLMNAGCERWVALNGSVRGELADRFAQ